MILIHFLDPMVAELRKFWSGIVLTCSNGRSKLVKCALLCVACDLPAGRKTCRFLGHNARLGCSRCYKEFSGGFGTTDYSGFDRENWLKHDGKEHRRIGMGASPQCQNRNGKNHRLDFDIRLS